MRDLSEQTRVELRRAGFPGTLVPSAVCAFHLDPASGRFQVTLERPVEVRVRGQVVVFASTVTGVLHPQRIWALEGVQVARGAERPPVREVRTDERSTMVTFEVSGVHQTVPYDDLL